VRTSAGAVLALCLAVAVACEHEPSEPVELDLTSFGLVYDGDRPRPLAVETAGGHRRIDAEPGRQLDFYVRLPRDARLLFTVDPQTPPNAFAIQVDDRAATVRRVAEGDWEATLPAAVGAIVRLRLENRGTAPLAWWAPRLVGSVRPRAPLLSPSDRPPPGPVNVVYVLVDAMRGDHLSLLGDRRPTSPVLERLAAAHGVVFEHAYAVGPSTPNSIPTLFTSRYPSALGINFGASRGGHDRTLAEAFSLAGARTAAFVGNPLMLEAFGYPRGFANYEIVRTGEGETRFPRADVMVGRALEYLSVNRDAPSFLYVHLMDVHSPFDPPPPFRDRFAHDGTIRLPEPSRPRALRPEPLDLAPPEPAPGPWRPTDRGADDLDPTHYDEAIAWVDDQIGRLVAGFRDLGVAERTVLVVTADHGEALGNEDDGTFLHGHSLYEELVHVPIVLVLPWLERGRRIADVVSAIDLAPTLLDLAGVPVPASFTGHSWLTAPPSIDPPGALFERLEPQWTTRHVLSPGRYGVAEWGMREGPWKLIYTDGRVRLFDLSADPKETKSVDAEHPDVVRLLVGRIARTSPTLVGREQPPHVDPTQGVERPLTEALKALGYLDE
jgi:arylsulfatase